MSPSTPLDIVQEKYSVLCKDISKISKKFNQRWPDIGWPIEGSFDLQINEKIKLLVHGYRADQKTNQRTLKRKTELSVLAMFSDTDVKEPALVKEPQSIDTMVHNKDSGEKTEINFHVPVDTKCSIKEELGAVRSLKMNLITELTESTKAHRQYLRMIDKQLDELSETETRLISNLHGKTVHSHRDNGDSRSSRGVTTWPREDMNSDSSFSDDGDEDLRPTQASQKGDMQTMHDSLVCIEDKLDCLHTSKMITIQNMETYKDERDIVRGLMERLTELSSKERDLIGQRDMAIRQLDKLKDKQRRGIRKRKYEEECGQYRSNSKMGFCTQEHTSTREDNKTDLQAGTPIPAPRGVKLVESPSPIFSGTVGATQLPVLQAVLARGYQPWCILEMKEVTDGLPSIKKGAALWISQLEDRLKDKELAMGDIKRLISSVLDSYVLENVLTRAGLHQYVDSTDSDGVPFLTHKRVIWLILRELYPIQIDPADISVGRMSETETPHEFISRVYETWEKRTGRQPDNDLMMRACIRLKIGKCLPEKVRRNLETVAGVGRMPLQQYIGQIEHFMDTFRKEQEIQREEEAEVVRNLNQGLLAETLVNAATAVKQEAAVQPRKDGPVAAELTGEGGASNAQRQVLPWRVREPPAPFRTQWEEGPPQGQPWTRQDRPPPLQWGQQVSPQHWGPPQYTPPYPPPTVLPPTVPRTWRTREQCHNCGVYGHYRRQCNQTVPPQGGELIDLG